MRYIQLQNILQNKMSELERVCLRERELLEGKWKTHSLPARKKAATSPIDGETNLSPSDSDLQPPFYRPTLSTEDVNLGRQRHTIIPPPAQFMLTYQYLDPNCRYVLKPSTSSSSGEYFVSVRPPSRSPSDHHYILARGNSTENASSATSYQHVHRQQTPVNQDMPSTDQHREESGGNQNNKNNAEQQKPPKSGRHCHGGHSCNPCIGHFGKKSDKNGDNTSLDAYDLASPCCDPHCVPTRRRVRHHKEHHHKHKHRDKETKERQRPRSQSHASSSPSNTQQTKTHHHHHHHHQQQQQGQQTQPQHHQVSHVPGDMKAHRSRYFDLTTGLASHCSLHSCTSSEFAPAESSASYTTSLSTDTLYWDPQSDNTGTSRQHSTKSRQSFHQVQNTGAPHTKQPQQQTAHLQQQGVYQHRYHLHTAQIQPTAHIYHPQYVHKPKSWDNLTTKAFGGYGFGYGYLDTVGPKPTIKMQITQQRHSIPRKNPYGRYSTFTDVENYAPPPSQFVEETTTTTTITTKSTENLINASNTSEASLRCDCTESQGLSGKQSVGVQYHASHTSSGYYSNLRRSTTNASTSTRNDDVATISEVTRL